MEITLYLNVTENFCNLRESLTEIILLHKVMEIVLQYNIEEIPL